MDPLKQWYVEDVIEEGCIRVGAYSDAALELLLGVCAVESSFGKYRRQLGNGPARGIFQMEPATFYWLLNIYGKRFPWLIWHCDALIDDDVLASALCRLRFRIVKSPLPDADDLWAQAEYWKKWYNTYKGKGTVQGYIQAYRKYVQR